MNHIQLSIYSKLSISLRVEDGLGSVSSNLFWFLSFTYCIRITGCKGEGPGRGKTSKGKRRRRT